MGRCLGRVHHRISGAAIIFAGIIVLSGEILPELSWAVNDPLVVETPRQVTFLAVAAATGDDSLQVGKKTAAATSAEDAKPGADEFIAVEQMPEQIYMAQPVYPAVAKKSGAEGDVWIKALIDKHGKVIEAMISKETKPGVGFGEAALAAATQCTYKPAVGEDGNPVMVWAAYKVAFRLAEKGAEKGK